MAARIYLTASPGAKVSSIERAADGSLRVRVAAPPVEGKANRELVRFLAERLEVPPSSVRIAKGVGVRYKTVEVAGLTVEEALERLQVP